MKKKNQLSTKGRRATSCVGKPLETEEVLIINKFNTTINILKSRGLVNKILYLETEELLSKIKKITNYVMSHLHCSDIVDLISDHIDLFRRNQAAIGRDVMLTLSSEERDERLKFHLMKSKELHPALISPESEYKV
jgi:hypothetical protein